MEQYCVVYRGKVSIFFLRIVLAEPIDKATRVEITLMERVMSSEIKSLTLSTLFSTTAEKGHPEDLV